MITKNSIVKFCSIFTKFIPFRYLSYIKHLKIPSIFVNNNSYSFIVLFFLYMFMEEVENITISMYFNNKICYKIIGKYVVVGLNLRKVV